MATPAAEAKTNSINSGTAEGLIAFFDFLVEKGYATSAQVAPWGSAAKQVFQRMEGEEWGAKDVRDLDLSEYMSRFENVTTGEYKQESLAAYRRRVARGIEAYNDFLESRKTPNFKPRQSRAKAAPATPSPNPADASKAARTHVPHTPPAEPLIDIPFPLQSGELAYVRLPRRITRGDAERMAALVKTFVIEEPRQLSAGHDESGAEGR